MGKKVILITGATSGIGKAVAIRAASEGHQLIITGRREDKLNEIVDVVGEQNALAVVADATDYKQLEKVVAQGVKHWGRLDVAYANAGIGVDQAGAEKGNPEEWDQLIDINVKALLWTAHLTLPHLRKQKGHFILTSSVAGKIALPGSVYGASKWFAYGFGQNLAQEMAEWDGRCTSICPGMVNTAFFDEPKPEKLDPKDVADAVMFAINADPKSNIREVTLMPTH